MNPKPFLAEKDLRNGVQTEFMLANGNSGPLTEAEVAALRCQLPAVPYFLLDFKVKARSIQLHPTGIPAVKKIPVGS